MRRHIHIVGCSPRSGTTLLQEMMVSCFVIDHYCEHERSVFKEPLAGDGVSCTKHPRQVFFAEQALRANPNLYFIYLVRDPRDVVCSRHAKVPGKYYASLSFYVRAERFARRLAGHPRFLVLRYEDLVCTPDLVQSEIQEKVPFLKKRFPFSQFHLHANVSKGSFLALNGVRPPDAKSIGRWKDHLKRVSAQFHEFPDAFPILPRYGYEPDSGWAEGLPAPSLGEVDSVMRDHTGAVYELRLHWRILRKTIYYRFRVFSTRLSGG